MNKNRSSRWVGAALIIVGLLFLADTTSLFGAFGLGWVIRKLWPLLLVVFGVDQYRLGKHNSGIFFMFLGAMFLLSTMFGWGIWAVFWPAVIIYVGISMLADKDHGVNRIEKGEVKSDLVNDTVIFWGIEKKVTSKEFKGGDIVAIFGGGQLDLRDAKLAKGGADINVTAIFGGLKILVPTEGYAVDSRGSGIFGGWSNKFVSNAKKGSKTLTLDGIGIFGGVEVANV